MNRHDRLTQPRSISEHLRALVLVAHPDDEILWAGGTILMHPDWDWKIYTLCRKDDHDRAPRFYRVLNSLGATGGMGTMDDGPEQLPLPLTEVQRIILHLLPRRDYDLVFTHSPAGEYTRHLRHEETGQAVLDLWKEGEIHTNEIRLFAYGDGGNQYFPKAILESDDFTELPENIWQRKYELITNNYGFLPESFEAQTTPRAEAFWRVTSTEEIHYWIIREEA